MHTYARVYFLYVQDRKFSATGSAVNYIVQVSESLSGNFKMNDIILNLEKIITDVSYSELFNKYLNNVLLVLKNFKYWKYFVKIEQQYKLYVSYQYQ